MYRSHHGPRVSWGDPHALTGAKWLLHNLRTTLSLHGRARCITSTNGSMWDWRARAPHYLRMLHGTSVRYPACGRTLWARATLGDSIRYTFYKQGPPPCLIPEWLCPLHSLWTKHSPHEYQTVRSTTQQALSGRRLQAHMAVRSATQDALAA